MVDGPSHVRTSLATHSYPSWKQPLRSWSDGEVWLDSVECFDLSTNQWRPAPSLTIPRRDHAAAELYGRLYVAGGAAAERILSSMECFDPKTRTWSLLP